VIDTRVLLLALAGADRDGLAAALRREGVTVSTAEPETSARTLAAAWEHDLVVLDADLPHRGYERILGAIVNGRPGHPVILLAEHATVADRVAGLDAGAIDFLVKPPAVPEVDILRRMVSHRGVPLHLPEREFRLLVFFLQHPGRICTRDEISGAVWDDGRSSSSNAVNVYVGYLRRRLARQGVVLPLLTVRRAGYRLQPAGQSTAGLVGGNGQGIAAPSALGVTAVPQ
jgi:DNA-binding response OmpR family regulator